MLNVVPIFFLSLSWHYLLLIRVACYLINTLWMQIKFWKEIVMTSIISIYSVGEILFLHIIRDLFFLHSNWQICFCAAYLFPSCLDPEILEGLLGSGSPIDVELPINMNLVPLIWFLQLVLFFFVFCIAVGGVMAFLTLHEMLPLAFDYAGQKQAVKAVFLGMAFMSARLVV